MFKVLKDARRRSVETLLGAIGSTERTADAEFDLHSERFVKMMDDMCDSGKALSDVLDRQKQLSTGALLLATTIEKIYTTNSEDPWSSTTSDSITQGGAASAYKDAWDDIHTQIRSSIQAVQNDHGLEPIRACVQQLRPEYDSAVKVRTESVVDYDSYRRRLKNLKDKQALNRQQGKDVGNAAAEMKSEIDRYEAKTTSAELSYKDQNEKLKNKINQAKSMHDTLMDDFLITAIVTQAELFSRAAQKLNDVIDVLPKDRVIKCRAQIETMLDPSTRRPKPSMPALSMAPLAPTSPAPSAAAAPKTPVVQQAVPFASSSSATPALTSNPFGSEDIPAEPVQTVFAVPAPTAAKMASFVTALYDHVADADDELDFSVGDKVEVLEQGDGGWWTGRCHGKVGLFPTNYVDTSDL